MLSKKLSARSGAFRESPGVQKRVGAHGSQTVREGEMERRGERGKGRRGEKERVKEREGGVIERERVCMCRVEGRKQGGGRGT